MTLTDVFALIAVLGLGVVIGVGFACHRLRGSLRTRPPVPATLMQAVAKTLGGGGGGPIEPF